MLDWQGEGEVIVQNPQYHSYQGIVPRPAWTWLPSLSKPSRYQLRFYSLLRTKFQHTCWWLKNTASPLDHYRNNKVKLIKMVTDAGVTWYAVAQSQAEACAQKFWLFQNVMKLIPLAEKKTARSKQTSSRLHALRRKLSSKSWFHKQILVELKFNRLDFLEQFSVYNKAQQKDRVFPWVVVFAKYVSSVYWYDHVTVLFHPVVAMAYTNWFPNVEPALLTWDKSHLVVRYNFLYTLLCSIR